jgi:hypothetical protein
MRERSFQTGRKASKKGIQKRKKSRRFKRKQGGRRPAPEWVNIVNYRTMDDAKKKCAAESGCHSCQTEWMREEINEFYEAILNGNRDEIEDEAMGLIRTYQQFQGCSDVVELWEQVRGDVLHVFSSRDTFESAFEKWHKKKLAKKQAIGVLAEDLIHEAGLVWG